MRILSCLLLLFDSLLFLSFFFFFFQAEDGIRDLTVTGVQTCALPISMAAGRELILVVDDDPKIVALVRAYLVSAGFEVRSEERRVGKECRSRWSPYH